MARNSVTVDLIRILDHLHNEVDDYNLEIG